MANILICTGIYPPAIGGPSQYAKEVAEEFRKQNHVVNVLTYGKLIKFPTIIRHEIFFWRTLFKLRKVDFILALDTFSVAWPATVAAKLLNKKIIIRTGGDFLWESYVERTGDLVLFKDFYTTCLTKLNWKERKIFQITKWTLQNATAVIFSTEWQKQIFEPAYKLSTSKNFIVENFYGGKYVDFEPHESERKIFISGGRNIKLKNTESLKDAFVMVGKQRSDIELSLYNLPHTQFMDKLRVSYVVILVSFSEISPNMILEAIRYNKPFILTKETGLYEKLEDVGIFADPKDIDDIKEKILFLSDRNNYELQKSKIKQFNFQHSWAEICEEIILIAKK